MSSVIGITTQFRKHKCTCKKPKNCPTVIHRLTNFTGTEITAPFNLSEVSGASITEGGLNLMLIEDYVIQGNKFVFNQEIQELNVIITYFDVCGLTGEDLLGLQGFPSIEAAKEFGLTVGQFFYLTENNIGSMYRQTLVYIAE